jgi:predicted transposase YdaD
MKTDKLFHRLFLEYPELAFELAGEPCQEDAGYRQESIELKETSFRTDGVLLPKDPQGTLRFWEAQLYPDDSFYRRWIASIFLFLHQHPWTRWQALVIYPDRATERYPPPSHAFLLELGLIRRVYLSDLLELEHPTWFQGLLRLIVLDPAQVAAQTQRLVRDIDQRPAKLGKEQALDLLEILLVNKLPHLGYQEIRAMISIPDTRLQDTQFFKDVVAIGRQEGRQEGESNEALGFVLRQLRHRFGAPVAEHEGRIRGLSLERLRQLGEDLLDFQQAQDLARWLDARGGR